jgi:tetraacyldisaccharide-1-P 4'-kinase
MTAFNTWLFIVTSIWRSSTGTILAGDGRIFPAGILREPLIALHRADAVVFTGITGIKPTKSG